MWRITLATVMIVYSTAAGISGSLVFKGDVAKPPAKLTLARVILAKPDDGERLSRVGAGLLPLTTLPGANVGEDGTFLIDDVEPGTYFINVAFIPAPWKLASAMYRGRDVAEEGLTIDEKSSTSGTLALTFSDRPTLVSGSVRSADGGTPTSCTVLALPQNRLLWNVAGARRKMTTAAPDGNYAIRDLPPGHYVVAAAVDVENADLRSPAYLEGLGRRGIKVTIADGQRVVQNLVAAK